MRFPHPGGYGGFAQIASDVVTGLFFLVVLAVVVGLIFLLVRYLLVATKAAQLYIANNSGPVAATPVAPSPVESAPVATIPPAPTAPAPAASNATTATLPATTPRTPKRKG